MACQAPLFMDFSRPEYWSGLPFPSPGDLPEPGFEPWSLALQADFLSLIPKNEPNISEETQVSCEQLLSLKYIYIYFFFLLKIYLFGCEGS